MGIRFDMVGLFVEDLAKMVEFYRDVLGVEIDWNGIGPYAEFKHEGIRFAMYERAKLPGLLGQTPSYPVGINGTFELAIVLPSFVDVDPEYQRLVRAGATPIYAPRDEPWGMRSSMVADPEGNLIEVGSWNTGTGKNNEEKGMGLGPGALGFGPPLHNSGNNTNTQKRRLDI